jgi:hypothetical protein
MKFDLQKSGLLVVNVEYAILQTFLHLSKRFLQLHSEVLQK